MTNNFGMGSLGLGSLGNMLESVDMMKKAWSSFNLPASFTPTMDVGELDKRIADLKTVEQWLNVNLSMLRGTIQGMEIQRGTLAAIQAFGQALSPQAEGFATMAAAAAAQAAQSAMSVAGSATGDGPLAGPPSNAETAPPPSAAPSASTGTTDTGGADGATDSDGSMGAEMTRAAAAAVNPAAWWSLLQSQFNQIAQATLAGAAPADSQKTPADRSARPAGPARSTRKAAGAGKSGAGTKSGMGAKSGAGAKAGAAARKVGEDSARPPRQPPKAVSAGSAPVASNRDARPSIRDKVR